MGPQIGVPLAEESGVQATRGGPHQEEKVEGNKVGRRSPLQWGRMVWATGDVRDSSKLRDMRPQSREEQVWVRGGALVPSLCLNHSILSIPVCLQPLEVHIIIPLSQMRKRKSRKSLERT